MIGRLFWIILGAAAVFLWWHWDEINDIVQNRKAISAGAKAYNAVGDLIDAGKTLYHEVAE